MPSFVMEKVEIAVLTLPFFLEKMAMQYVLDVDNVYQVTTPFPEYADLSSFPYWGYPVFFLYQMRRVRCSTCGVTKTP